MNQTKKRLQIINIAISITDIETIQLQILKLASLRSDAKLKEILDGLQAQNYAQTQSLITKYIETPTEEIVQRTSQNDQEIIEEFDLFVTTPEEPVQKETELFDFDTLLEEVPEAPEKTAEKQPETQQSSDFDNLLNLTADDIMPDNIEIDINQTPKDTFFDTPAEDVPSTKESHIDTDFIPKDTFFDTVEEEEGKDTLGDRSISKKEDSEVKSDTENTMLFEEHLQEEPETARETEEEVTFFEETTGKEALPVQEEPVENAAITAENTTPTEKKSSDQYKNIPYIDQKLKNMLTQYPPLLETQENYDTVNNWLLKISNEGYSEEEVEEVILHIGRLKESNAIAEAAQLLLICGATESKYAQFMLARELFRGEILEKNLPEAFTLINRLAMDDDYPEAICDLAQFYENGVGIDKDKKRAEMLYKEAMELGVKRAAAHYERLHSSNKGLIGKLFGKK